MSTSRAISPFSSAPVFGWAGAFGGRPVKPSPPYDWGTVIASTPPAFAFSPPAVGVPSSQR
jgi:hypothetical protein